MKEEFTGFSKILGYCLGMAGWSVMINSVTVMLVYFYLPPANTGLLQLVPDTAIVGILTVFSVVLASGRLLDAITDPLIAWFSDRLKTRWGRRVPLMFVAVFPTFIFATLLFFPPFMNQHQTNLTWLLIIQAGFYVFITLYIVPYNALMPELARTRDQKLIISMFLSLAYVSGMIIASQIPFLADHLAGENAGISHENYRMALLIVNITATILMIAPFFVINEGRYCNAEPSRINVITSLKTVLSNRSFMLFIVADASFFVTIAIIASGTLYYVKVLLGLSEIAGSFFLGGMILLSLFLYPLVVKLTKLWGKKKLILISFAIFIFLFFWISQMGRMPFAPIFQMGVLAFFASFPAAVLGILPYAIIAESAERSAIKTGENTEAMFFAVRTFADKFGQTLGITGFAILMIFGKDPGNDMGIRLTAILGLLVCLIAFLVFLFWEE